MTQPSDNFLKKQVNDTKLVLKKIVLGIKQALRSVWYRGVQQELAVNGTPQTNNPYIAARLEWNYLFKDLIKAKHNWQILAFLSSIANLLLIIGLIAIALQSKVIPYVVKVNSLGDANFAGYLDKGAAINALEINNFVRRYITKVRSITADPIVQKHELDFVYTVSLGETTKFLNQYYRQNNPFQKAQQITTDIDINGALEKSDNTWQVNWTETQRSLEGNIIAQTHWEALITVEHKTVSKTAIINVDPLGLFVNHLSWSQQL